MTKRLSTRCVRSARLGTSLATAAAAFMGCSAHPGPQSGSRACSRSITVKSETLAAASASPYEVNATWVSDTGERVRLDDMRGKPRLISMLFTNCQGVCLLTLEYMQEIDASLPADLRNRVGFVLVTLDPSRDTPDKLAVYRRENGLSASHWTLLRGDAAATAALAAHLAITFSRESTRGFVHSTGITLVDGSGNIIQQQFGSHPDLHKMVGAVKAVIGKEAVAVAPPGR